MCSMGAWQVLWSLLSPIRHWWSSPGSLFHWEFEKWRYTDSLSPSALMLLGRELPRGAVGQEVGLVLLFPMIYPSSDVWEVLL